MVDRPVVAYFSMEIGLEPPMPTYAGGLGILAGDTVPCCPVFYQDRDRFVDIMRHTIA